ncbi:MAG: hypothetical protein LUM44_12740 [Pyrinomonadaceae bacterium]|nr:hypothetical protein [Pyrinomonadaceae bacterium]
MAKLKGLAKLEETESGWETNAPGDKFFDHTLVQYKAEVQLSRDAEAEVLQKKQEFEAAKNKFKDVTKRNLKLEQNIAKAIAGDPRYGDDSALYESTGRVRKSERQTGLTRKKKNGGNTE